MATDDDVELERRLSGLHEAPFAAGDSVIARSGQFLYRATVEKVAFNDKGPIYELKYSGWGPEWNDWNADVLPNSPENIDEMNRLLDEAAEMELQLEENKIRKASANSATPGATVPLPSSLRQILAKDCLLRSIGKPLLLPTASPCARVILSDFVATRGSAAADKELAKNFEELLAETCATHLLYPCELKQDHGAGLIQGGARLSNIAAQGVSSTVGPMHVLRLIVKLPALLQKAGASADRIKNIVSIVKHLADYLASHIDNYFHDEIVVAWNAAVKEGPDAAAAGFAAQLAAADAAPAKN
ncbi:hypothetical protein PPROV_000286200 [Pycnococcus provasolii]|uniref:MRG domain-containing protein n=1 Tax=Pycnococcus provasolii TaxID=41880 RepID=A0A830HBI2_9CHLO|nr:hypothetical protein PPROV_000286200 [Pycnococcus provasolii]